MVRPMPSLLLKTYSAATHINVGSGQDVTILELAELVSVSSASRERSLPILQSLTERRAS